MKVQELALMLYMALALMSKMSDEKFKKAYKDFMDITSKMIEPKLLISISNLVLNENGTAADIYNILVAEIEKSKWHEGTSKASEIKEILEKIFGKDKVSVKVVEVSSQEELEELLRSSKSKKH